jgi:hypothetical protein
MLNELNVQRLDALGLPAAIEHTRRGDALITVRMPSGEIVAHGLDGVHRTEQFVDAAKPARERLFVEADSSGRATATALLAVGHAAARVREVHEDGRLSREGRDEATVEAVTKALTAVGSEFARVNAEGLSLAAERARLYQVPEPDVVAAVLDGELRRDFAARDSDERAELLRELEEPQYRALALALSRSPLPLKPGDAQIVSRAWAAHVDRDEPAKTSALAKATAANASAAGLLKELASALTRGFAKGARPLDRQTVYQALRPITGAWPVDFPAGERGFLEHQIKAAEAERATQAGG